MTIAVLRAARVVYSRPDVVPASIFDAAVRVLADASRAGDEVLVFDSAVALIAREVAP